MFFFALCLAFVIGAYILNFKSNTISGDPSNWGVLGDYIGGVLNPLISLFTLIFLVKTYLSQKEELHQSEMAAKEQLKISRNIVEAQLLNTKISASYELISVYKSEMDGATSAMNGPRGGRAYTAIDGKVYWSDEEQKSYRKDMAKKIDQELKYIKELLNKV